MKLQALKFFVFCLILSSFPVLSTKVFAAKLTCPPSTITEDSYPVKPVIGTQPLPEEIGPIFEKAAGNLLGVDGPTYPPIGVGYPHPQFDPNSRVPAVLLKAVGWQESTTAKECSPHDALGWKQFMANYGQQGKTLITFDFGYGIMQTTFCWDVGKKGKIECDDASTAGQGNGHWIPLFTDTHDRPIDRARLASDYKYNIGVGATVLIDKWNIIDRYVGTNDPDVIEDWYFAVWTYQGGFINNPNNLRYYGQACKKYRAKFNEASLYNIHVKKADEKESSNTDCFPYQEKIWGLAKNPPKYQGNEVWQSVDLRLPASHEIGNLFCASERRCDRLIEGEKQNNGNRQITRPTGAHRVARTIPRTYQIGVIDLSNPSCFTSASAWDDPTTLALMKEEPGVASYKLTKIPLTGITNPDGFKNIDVLIVPTDACSRSWVTASIRSAIRKYLTRGRVLIIESPDVFDDTGTDPLVVSLGPKLRLDWFGQSGFDLPVSLRANSPILTNPNFISSDELSNWGLNVHSRINLATIGSAYQIISTIEFGGITYGHIVIGFTDSGCIIATGSDPEDHTDKIGAQKLAENMIHYLDDCNSRFLSANRSRLGILPENDSFIFEKSNAKAIRISVLDLFGRTVLDTNWVPNNFIWYGRDTQGRPLPNGVYLYVITTRREDGTIIKSEVKKLVILR